MRGVTGAELIESNPGLGRGKGMGNSRPWKEPGKLVQYRLVDDFAGKADVARGHAIRRPAHECTAPVRRRA